jgi:adenylylsulfate kinase-like enzyme
MGNYKDTESLIHTPVLCICGESGAGKTFTANKIKNELIKVNINPVILDGDAIRKYVNYSLGYSEEDRRRNNEIIANIAELLYYQGHQIIISTVRADIAYNILLMKNINCELLTISNKEIINYQGEYFNNFIFSS